MGPGNKSRRGLKICCCVTALLLIIILVVAIVLFFTVFKPKEPKIITQAVTLEHFKFVPLPFHLNVTLGIVVTIDNPNYGSFKYENSTAYVTYHGSVAAEGPIQQDKIPARGKHDVTTTVVLVVDTLTSSPYFLADFVSGSFNFTSSTTLKGKATVLKFLKIKATSYSTCDISVFFLVQNATSVCSTKIKY